MTSVAPLPPGLEPWGEALSVLTPTLVAGLQPLLHGLDDLIHRRDAGSGPSGPLDGYDGLTARGTPERIVMSEWLLADELPLEFLRRAAQNELLYLAPSYQRPQPRGRVVVLVDNGPDQLGAPRLVQLAALIVLHRRSAVAGAGMTIGALDDEPGNWLDGNLGSLLHGWLKRRGRARPGPVSVELRLEQLDPKDEVWVLAGRDLAAGLTGRRRVVRIDEGAYGPSGVSELHVDLDGDSVELALPRTDLSVRALRGSAFLSGEHLSTAGELSGMRNPTFSSQARQLLIRGDGDNEILSVAIASERSSGAARIRRHRFPGPVLAAAHLGRRLAALVLDGDQVRVSVVGKALKQLDGLALPVSDFRATSDELEAAATDALPPLFYVSGELLCSLHGSWRLISPQRTLQVLLETVAPGHNVDTPRIARSLPQGITIDHHLIPGTADVSAVVLGHANWCAVSDDGLHWRPSRLGREFANPITIGSNDEVLALVTDDDEPKLVTVSAGGLVVRLVGADSLRTLTSWSGGPGRPSIHPTLPLVAVQRADDLIEVGDIFSGEVLHVIRSVP
jgi:hypothetical protein